MGKIADNLQALKRQLPQGVGLVAVSKFHPVEELREAYSAGQRLFGENRAQELCAKAPLMPADVQWHFIGHLQTNKVRQIMPHVAMIQSIDSVKLLRLVGKALPAGHPLARGATVAEAEVAREFSTVKQTFEALRSGAMAGNEAFAQVSMGMSHDWPEAVSHGATLVRIGTAIFGPREY